MKNYKNLLIMVSVAICFTIQLKGQTKVYTISNGELLFQWADIEFTDEYKLANPQDEVTGSPLRFSMFVHLGQNIHLDFNDYIGLYSGLALRNVGFISNERLLDQNNLLQDYKIIRRSYNLGIPLAIKLGSFDNHFFFYGGGELELQFAFKEKYWTSHNRSGSKSKNTEWFGNQTNTFIPSIFAGVQFPRGVNVKFKYYLDDFLNTNYKNVNQKVSDLRRYKQTQLMLVAVSWQFETEKFFKKSTKQKNNDEIAL